MEAGMSHDDSLKSRADFGGGGGFGRWSRDWQSR